MDNTIWEHPIFNIEYSDSNVQQKEFLYSLVKDASKSQLKTKEGQSWTKLMKIFQ